MQRRRVAAYRGKLIQIGQSQLAHAEARKNAPTQTLRTGPEHIVRRGVVARHQIGASKSIDAAIHHSGRERERARDLRDPERMIGVPDKFQDAQSALGRAAHPSATKGGAEKSRASHSSGSRIWRMRGSCSSICGKSKRSTGPPMVMMACGRAEASRMGKIA